ncbi:outer membrane receptor protein involved in Fe transport [Nitrospirillum amazonense]|uniref:Outer membrane receptor protein involved in Fe transport n=1 Tax=Nitrospirillum amazonense TaxID=28077 RepID=A0A560FFH4_9PROT|nr:TonB-dependent receptor [Nitrospirillum amazonense]TWB20349.1 outer membrane receptor protein involved in Fe transport [Nitrospirillum amazonense]
MIKGSYRLRCGIGAVALVLGPVWAAAAQEAGPDVGQLDEIIVTAQKRAQSADSVGMSITTLSGADLQRQGVDSVGDLARVDPSFVVSQTNYSSPVYSIRGVSYNDFSIAATPTVSVYTDEVPYAYPALSKGATFDLERVEVLKGPQGTLYGQNATGGAVNYIAAKPTNQFEAGLDGTLGRFAAAGLDGFVSGPISDTLAGRFAFSVREGGDWQQSTTRDETLGQQNSVKLRALLDWNPTDALQVQANFNGFIDRSDLPAANLVKIVLQRQSSAALVPNTTKAKPGPDDPEAADWLAGTTPRVDESTEQASLRADYALPRGMTLTYLGSFQHFTQNDLNEPQGANYHFSQLQSGIVNATSQELRLSGKEFDDRLNWLVGADYAKAYTRETQLYDLAGSSSSFALTNVPLLIGKPAIPPFSGNRSDSDDDSISRAAFGNIEYHPLEELGITAGARYTTTAISHGGCTRDTDGNTAAGATVIETILKHGVGVVPAVRGGCTTLDASSTPAYINQRLSEDNVSWRVGLNWTPVERTLIYGTVSRGFKAGSFPTLSASSYLQLRPVTQEELLAYELGVKTRLLNNRLEIDGALFHYDYTNKQLEARSLDPNGVFGLLSVLVNVPKSKEDGAEFSLRAKPLDNLTVTAKTTYLHSLVESDYFGYNAFTTTPVNFKGQAFPNTPRWSFLVDAQYDWSVSSAYTAFVGASARYQTKTQGLFGTQSAISQGYPSTYNADYGVIDLRAGLSSVSGTWRFEGFVRNLTNTFYAIQTTRVGDSVVRFQGQPTTYGVTVSYRY